MNLQQIIAADRSPTPAADDGLPEPVAWQKTCPHVTHLRTAALMADTPEEFDGLDRHGWAPLYTADQMRAAIAAERERCRRASCQPSADTQAQLDDWERAIRPAQGGVRAEAGRRVLEQIVSGAAPALSDEDLADCGLLSELDP